MNDYGFIKVAACSPKIKVANTHYNIEEIERIMRQTDSRGVSICVFPELSITGYTCGDLFLQNKLLDSAEGALLKLTTNTKDLSVLALVGMPLMIKQRLYNCAVAIQRGKVLGVVPKMFLPNYKEFYEKRWFSSGLDLKEFGTYIKLLGYEVPFGNILFKGQNSSACLGVEVCEDLWTPIPPSSYLALGGANIIANLSASNELVGKSEYREQLVAQQSAKCVCGYIYSSSGVFESTTDIVFSGDCIVSENGTVLRKSKRFQRDNSIIYSDIDTEKLMSERTINKSFSDSIDMNDKKFITVPFEINQKAIGLDREINPLPFVPNNPAIMDTRCDDIFSIQVAGLAKRLEHTNNKNVVIGVSGGLDSTLALLVVKMTFEKLGIPSENIHAITMPGFGTTDLTYQNALALMKSLNVSMKEVDIKPSCIQHFNDIGHDMSVHDVTYENVQARMRTLILMDMANKVNGFVIGTGDLSELALGWCTYNGDHMSGYNVNVSIPKTLVRFLVRWYAENIAEKETSDILLSIVHTPISPELLPPSDKGDIVQITEDVVGPYELHDFFLFYTIKYGVSPKKILYLATIAFKDKYSEETIKTWLKKFYWRFFSQQFKRSCLPDGPKVGSVSLSPRGDWRMPSDADVSMWIKELE